MTDLPTAPPMVPPAIPSYPGTGDEVLVAFAGSVKQNRLTVLVRLVLAIPHLVVLWILGIAIEVVLVISWFAALFTGRVPQGLADFMAGYLRWATRVYAYLYLLTDQYPPFEMGDSDYPVHLAVRPGRLNRLAVFFRGILAIPAWLVALFLIYGLGTIFQVVVWLIVLIAGVMPKALYDAIAAVERYLLRLYGYAFLLTGTYPKGLFGDQPGQAAYGQPAYGQPAYGQPAYGQPVPGQPADPPSSYAPPAGAAEPGYGQPGYAQPGSGTAAGWPGSDPQAWRLVLSGGSKALIWAFLVLGVLVSGAYIAVIAAASSNGTGSSSSFAPLRHVDAVVKVGSSYSALSASLTTFRTKTTACATKLTCVTAQDTQAAKAFGTFAQSLHGVQMPSARATAAASLVDADATAAQSDFLQLSRSTSVSQYQQAIVSTGFEQRLSKFDADFQKLETALGMG